MNKAQILRKKFEEDLEELRNSCSHIDTRRISKWAADYPVSSETLLICNECEKILATYHPPEIYQMKLNLA